MVDRDDWEGRNSFERPMSRSALRKSNQANPRNLPCPTCKEPNKLTPVDVRKHYQCDVCADRDEGRSFGMEG